MTQLPPVHRWDAISAPIGAVHVLHGMSDHAGRYSRLATALNDAGFVVWAHDHRGHGRNPTPPVGLGHFADVDGWRLVVDDAWRVSDELRTSYPTLPLILVAHSMGSFVAQALMPERGAAYRAVVLSGTDGPPGLTEQLVRATAVAQRSALGARAPGRWLTNLVFGTYNRQFAPNRTDFDWLSRDESEVDAYVRDDKCGFPLTTQSWLDFLNGRSALTRPENLRGIPRDLPVLVLIGSRDPVGGNGRGVQRLLSAYSGVGMHEVRSLVFDGARHEVFHESNRDEVFAALANWLTGVCRSGEQRNVVSH